MDEADVCAALAREGATDFSTCDVIAARDALTTAARANGWIVADAAPLSVDDLVMMATTPCRRGPVPRLRRASARHTRAADVGGIGPLIPRK